MITRAVMVPLISFLAALRILTEAHTCHDGEAVLYEVVPGYRLGGSGSFGNQKIEVITKSGMPTDILEDCRKRCFDDRTTVIKQCHSFSFLPGRRRSSADMGSSNSIGNRDPSGAGMGSFHAEFEQSSCYLYHDMAAPDGTGPLVQQENSWYFSEVCVPASRAVTECSGRMFSLLRIPGYRYDNSADEEVFASNRSECASKCVQSHHFVCLSATFDRGAQRCRLSRETRASNPAKFSPDPNSDYIENLCLSGSQLCTSTAFILEAGKKPEGVHEWEVRQAQDFQHCSHLCVSPDDNRPFRYVCRAFHYDEEDSSCALYPQDPLDNIGGHQPQPTLVASHGDFYRVLCGNSDKEAIINNATFELYRRKRLDSAHQVELKAYSFQECLDQCMLRYGRDCLSVEYSSRLQTCRFSSPGPGGPTPPNLVDDDSYDYYQFKWIRGAGNRGTSFINRHGYGGIATGYGNPGSNYGWSQHTGSYGGLAGSGPYGGGSGPYGGGSGPYGTHGSTYGGIYGGHGGSGAYGGHGGSGAYGGPYGSHGSSYGTQGGIYGSQGGSYGGSYGYGPYGGSGYGQQFPYNSPGGGFGGVYPPNQQHPPYPPTMFEPCKPGGGGGTFRRIGYGTRMRSFYIRRVARVDRVEDCERICMEERDFLCRSFNFRPLPPDNCEISDQDVRQLQLNNPSHFEQDVHFDYYERDGGFRGAAVGCIDVSQSCSPDGIEFIMKTPEGFYGRIYTYGFYDTCFYDGNGGTTSVLRISKTNDFPRCGTQHYGDVMTNIVVVQFNDNVQTSRDKKYNLTCYMSGPGEAVVTSSYMDTHVDGRYPTQIEHLPAQNIVTSNIVLRILYRGSPTNTIAVGDLLTFRIESRGNYHHYEYYSDIFATNVIAKDPYSGRQVNLIDSRGCPIDMFVFPELHRTPDGALEAEFYAFKIPDSNLLVFQATVRTCRGPCDPVMCSDRSRPGSFPSWGRKKRAVNNTAVAAAPPSDVVQQDWPQAPTNETEEEEDVHELMKVYLSRSDMPAEGPSAEMTKVQKVCVAQSGYYSLVAVAVVLVCLLLGVVALAVLFFRRMKLASKAAAAAGPPPALSNLYISRLQGAKMDDPSEPIYTDPSLFERTRSNHSMMMPNPLEKVRNQLN